MTRFPRDDQVHVIGHEDVGENLDAALGGMAFQEREVESAIVVGQKDVLAGVSKFSRNRVQA